jgi:UDPglucose 6-dehydrogenase
MYKIGIIGKGFVGSAVNFGFSLKEECEIKIYDKDPKKSQNSLSSVVNDSDFIFISVPTPSNTDGSINLKVVDKCLNEINKIIESDAILLLRSTMTPGSSNMFQQKYPKLNIVFNPEFLTERNADFDFINQSRFILGGNINHVKQVSKLYRWRFGSSSPIIETTFETAELIKYMNNCFLATKVSFLNEMKLIADECGADWKKSVEGFSLDKRIGNSHTAVPGPDGKLGFGGSCFPKDIQAMISYANKLDIKLNTLIGVWSTNLEVRPDKDWEQLIGRSVIVKD